MPDWNDGYVVDIDYIYGYYQELNPLRARLAFLLKGLAPPAFTHACELGFGQGLSLNIHAAASPIQWYGTDFNPRQAAFARELAQASGASAKLCNDAFADFALQSDLPEFDFIGLHGIWSWVSDDNRQVLVDFIRKRLKVGGVVYISYNALPGWASFAPMRQLLTLHAELLSAPGQGVVSRIDHALEFSQKLLATQPLYARLHPQIAERMKKVHEQNRHYLAHEYFNRDWQPMHFATLAKWLEPAKLEYAASAHYPDHIDAVNLTTEQQGLLNDIAHPVFRETVRDFMVNQQFRRDYWVKGARRLSPLEQIEALRATAVMLVTPRADVPLKVSGALGEATLSAAVYPPILDVLADHKARTLAQLEQALSGQEIRFWQLVQAIVVLAGAGHVTCVQSAEAAHKAKKTSDKLNAHLINLARSRSEVTFLASPVTGGGVAVGRFAQLFVQAYLGGAKTPAQWAQHAWNLLSAQGQKIVKEGKTLEGEQDNVAELTAQAEVFANKQLPILKALQVA